LSTAQLASHNHTITPGTFNGSPNTGYPDIRNDSTGGTNNQLGSAGSGQGHSHNMSANFAGDANSVLQPFLTLIYIIKT
jgi:hypothetical protein